MKLALKNMGVRTTLKKCEAIVEENDADGNGTIGVDEFVDFVMGTYSEKGKLGAASHGIGGLFGDAAKSELHQVFV